jgi:hypothetical protein
MLTDSVSFWATYYQVLPSVDLVPIIGYNPRAKSSSDVKFLAAGGRRRGIGITVTKVLSGSTPPNLDILVIQRVKHQ